MKTTSTFTLILLALTLLISACTAQPTPIDPTATPTPDPCTGWTCTLEGVVSGESGNALSGVTVDLEQVSNCSPTRGERQAITGEDGRFSFEIFLHDTDSFVFDVDTEGYEPVRVKMGGFDCLYCACDPVEIILTPSE